MNSLNPSGQYMYHVSRGKQIISLNSTKKVQPQNITDLTYIICGENLVFTRNPSVFCSCSDIFCPYSKDSGT